MSVKAVQKPVQIIKKEVVIIGAGLMGSAVAMGLARAGMIDVDVLDLDLAGEFSSSELNAGGVRATWSQKVNLLASKQSIEYFSEHAIEVGYRPCGYFWLHRKNTFQAALKAREMHVAHGWPVDVYDVAGIRNRLPFIDKTDDLVGGIFGVRDGLVNPNRLKEHYREEASKLGVQFFDRVWLKKSDRNRLHAIQFEDALTSEQKKILLTQNPTELAAISGNQANEVQWDAKVVINCAGAWAPEVAKRLGYDCLSKPVRRQISLFHARDLDLNDYGMIIDPSGVYFHPESIYGLSGYATRHEPEGFNFNYDGPDFFEEHIWSHLHERSTQFESLRHVSGWAGLYEESPDHHAIVGQVQGLDVPVFEAHSFSGHGAMQSYAVGVELANLIVTGRYQSLDLSELSADRFRTGKKIPNETWVI
jgi:FAD-dependent oxidoreductase domain-containing protein 1